MSSPFERDGEYSVTRRSQFDVYEDIAHEQPPVVGMDMRIPQKKLSRPVGKENMDSVKQCYKRKAKLPQDDCGSEQQTGKSSSRRKVDVQRKDLGSVIQSGQCDNIRKLQECLVKYDTKETGFSTHNGLLIWYDETDEGFELYSWLLKLGFAVPMNNDLPMLELPSSKISTLRAALSKHNISSSKMQCSFLEASRLQQKKKTKISTVKESSSLNNKHRSSKKKTSPRMRGLNKSKSENIMEKPTDDDYIFQSFFKQDAYDVKKTLEVEDSSLKSAVYNKTVGDGAGSSSCIRTFGRTSKQQDAISIDSFGVGVNVAPPNPEFSDHDTTAPTDRVVKDITLRESRLGRTSSISELLMEEVDEEDEDDFGTVRPLSTSSLPPIQTVCVKRGVTPESNENALEGTKPNRRRSLSETGHVSRKSPRYRDDTPSPQICCTSSDDYERSRSTDSVIKKLSNLGLSSASKLNSDSHYPPIPDDHIVTSSCLEDINHFSNEKEDGNALTLLAPRPCLSANSSFDKPTERSINDEHSGITFGSQSLLQSPVEFLGDGSGGFTPPIISSQSRPLSSQLSSQFTNCLSSCEDYEDEFNNICHDSSIDGKEVFSYGASYSQEFKAQLSDDSISDIPAGKKLKRGKTLPLPNMPQTPEVPFCMSQNYIHEGAGGGNNAHTVDFTTPITTTSCHVSGLPGKDFLVTDAAFDFEITKFRDIFKRKPIKTPVARDSLSPYLFSALSHRRLSQSRSSFIGDHSDEKLTLKEKKNNAFLKRMSRSGIKNPFRGSSFNPSTASKMKDRKSIISNETDLILPESTVRWDDLDVTGGHRSLDSSSFKGIIVGGTYENCFDDNIPVVSAPASSDRRVVGVQLLSDSSRSTRSGKNSKSLILYLVEASSRDARDLEMINLGRFWVCYKISTWGFLVSKSEILPHKKCVCYFVPMHPVKWAASTNNMSPKQLSVPSSPKSYLDVSIVDCDQFHEQHLHNNDHTDTCRIVSSVDHFAADESKIFHDYDIGDDHDQYIDNEYNQAICRKLHVSLGTSSNGSLNGCQTKNELNYPMMSEDYVDEEGDDDIIRQQNTQRMHYSGDGDEVVFLHLNTSDEGDDNEDNELEMSINTLRLDDDEYENFDSMVSKTAPNWNNSVVISSVISFLIKFSHTTSIELDMLSTVSRSWAIECCKIRASELSRPGVCQQLDRNGWMRFMGKYGNGRFLNSGACKDVFCVCPQHVTSKSLVESSPRFEAVSVMDMVDLRERDVAESITRELEISMLCSSLVSLKICPNLLQVYSIFQSEYPPSKCLWKRTNQSIAISQRPSPKVVSQAMSNLDVGEYQYIRMEFCESGDLEEIVRATHDFKAMAVRSLLFQMCFALYSCREQLSMRHYDIKLLNFFSTGAGSLLGDQERSMNTALQFVNIGFGDHIYSIPLENDSILPSQALVKLADFGTSSVGSSTLSLPITAHQFTTLENTPPEYLFLGSNARECFSADTFCLGLSFLHLVAGEEPYEEHLKKVHCPAMLLGKLKKLWRTPSRNSQYRLIAEVIESLDASDDIPESPDNIQNVLYDTLYRYLVLFDFDISSYASDSEGEQDYPYPPTNPVLRETIDCLGLGINSGNGPLTKAKRECMQQYNRDRAEWSIHFGTNGIIKRIRKNLSDLGGGALDLLCSMVNLDASKRCSLHEAITSPIFYALRVNEEELNLRTSSHEQSFMYYKSRKFLPIF